MDNLLSNQLSAIGGYDDIKSVAKAVDRMEYIATRTGRPLADRALVDAAMEIRANPRATADVLSELNMSHDEFVDACKVMADAYGSAT
jgi:hypothetical protein